MVEKLVGQWNGVRSFENLKTKFISILLYLPTHPLTYLPVNERYDQTRGSFYNVKNVAATIRYFRSDWNIVQLSEKCLNLLKSKCKLKCF